jgi:hypothetical protein
MHRLITSFAAAFICAVFGLADPTIAAAAGRGGGGFAHAGGGFAHGSGGGFHAFHGGAFRGFRGFGGGIYPYSVYGDYYPYSLYEDDYPDCRFVWVKPTVKHKTSRRGIWTCS